MTKRKYEYLNLTSNMDVVGFPHGPSNMTKPSHFKSVYAILTLIFPRDSLFNSTTASAASSVSTDRILYWKLISHHHFGIVLDFQLDFRHDENIIFQICKWCNNIVNNSSNMDTINYININDDDG